MEHITLSPQHHNILTCLICLPEKIITLHGRENVTSFVLQDLCGKKCFNVSKAAYLVDNPDFKCLKGIAGYAENQAYNDENHWSSPQKFDEYANSQSFNRSVRSIFKQDNYDAKQNIINDIAQDLAIKNYASYVWPMKHNNQGIFIYEPNQETEKYGDSLKRGLHLLSFCPIF